MVRRHEAEVAGRPHVHERVRPDARHPVLDRLRHLEVGKPGQLAVEDRIERRVLRRLAAEGVEERHRLVNVVHDRRMPLQIPGEELATDRLRVVDVAVVVVEDVLAPVRRPTHAVVLAGFHRLVGVVPVDVPVAAVRLGDRRERDDHVVADLLQQRRLFGGEPVGQLHQHLGRAGLSAVQASHQVVDRLGGRDDLVRLHVADPARVGELREISPVSLEVLHRLGGRNRNDDVVAAFIGLADRHHADTRRRRRQRAVIAEDVGVVGQFLRCTNMVTEDLLGRRNPRDPWEVIDEGAEELRRGRPLTNGPGKIVVLWLADTRARRRPVSQGEDDEEAEHSHRPEARGASRHANSFGCSALTDAKSCGSARGGRLASRRMLHLQPKTVEPGGAGR